MSKLATTFKEEITRLGRKEARRIAGPLKRRVTSLERVVREQRKALDLLSRQAAAALNRATHPAPASAAGYESDRARLTPANIRKMRTKLRLSQAQFATLAGVTPVAVYFWESGKTKPRGRTRESLVSLRAIGVREAMRRLEDPASNPAVPKRRRNKRRKRANAVAVRRPQVTARGPRRTRRARG